MFLFVGMAMCDPASWMLHLTGHRDLQHHQWTQASRKIGFGFCRAFDKTHRFFCSLDV